MPFRVAEEEIVDVKIGDRLVRVVVDVRARYIAALGGFPHDSDSLLFVEQDNVYLPATKPSKEVPAADRVRAMAERAVEPGTVRDIVQVPPAIISGGFVSSARIDEHVMFRLQSAHVLPGNVGGAAFVPGCHDADIGHNSVVSAMVPLGRQAAFQFITGVTGLESSFAVAQPRYPVQKSHALSECSQPDAGIVAWESWK